MVKEFLANSKREGQEKPKLNENKNEKEKEIRKKKEYDPFDFTLT